MSSLGYLMLFLQDSFNFYWRSVFWGEFEPVFCLFFFLIMNYSLLFLELFEQIQIKQQEMLLFVVLFVRWFCFVGFDFSLIKQNNKAFQISMKSFFK